jgi:hypothetical protein
MRLLFGVITITASCGAYPLGEYPQSQTAWVCAAAAANRSEMNCKQCIRGDKLAAIAPDSPPLHLSLGSSARQSLAWFTTATKPEVDPRPSAARNKNNDGTSYRAALANRTLDSLRVAIVSARLHAPSLAPFVMYLHTDDQPLEHDDFSRWLMRAGARVVLHRLTFRSRIDRGRRRYPVPGLKHINMGTWSRMDISQLIPVLKQEMIGRGLNTETILYTDADVIFQADPTPAPNPLPTFASGTEGFSPSMNSGVMFMNMTTFRAEWPGLLEHAARKHFRFTMAEQQWLQVKRLEHTYAHKHLSVFLILAGVVRSREEHVFKGQPVAGWGNQAESWEG